LIVLCFRSTDKQSLNYSVLAIILGIESSCDDTSAAICIDGKISSNVIANQLVHQHYGGVVPELASRVHQQNIVPAVHEAISIAKIHKNDIDVIAFTRGPGLLGSLLVGTSFAKGFALANSLPLIEVNHMQAHILAHFIDEDKPEFPFLCLTVSGGHTQIVLVRNYFDMEVVGQTLDDAAGEAFDKTAKILGLPYPGGPLIDSVAALVPKAEIEGEMGDSKMGLQARLMSQALRKLTGTISKTGCCCIFINQLREKIGVMFGNPETTTGGNALKFYASVRLDIRRISQIKDSDEVSGNRVKVKIVKNKVAPPFRIAEFDIMFGQGISKAGEIIDLGVEFDIVKKSGSWFSYGDTKLGQGRDAVKQLILDNPDLMDELEARIRAVVTGDLLEEKV
jgi:glycoprotease/Kae1 family metallohydrolase